ncbi:FecR family protein [Pseudomonas idahonensis]|uniref:FecR family protein n=1 Tax=Pseudomonas idahonensis TaxID=2942628 RepID=UPI0035C06EF2
MSRTASEQANRAAVDWLLKLESSSQGDAVQQAFAHWLAQSGEHAAAWQRVNAVLSQPLQQLQSSEQLQAASRALRSLPSPARRKVLGGGLALLVLGGGAAGLVNRVLPLGQVLADLDTATGQRQSMTLADGSRLHLNARSAVDIRFDAGQRRIVLREGTVQIDVAADPARPFIVESREGRVQALGTRFMVSRNDLGSLVSVQQHSVLLTTAQGRQQRVEAGEAFAFGAQGIERQAPSLRTRVDWLDGRIDVRNEPLGELIELLRPYRSGLLRISPEAARVRVYGVFPLDDSDQVLRSLSETLPIQVTRYGFWLTRIELR